MFPELGEKKRWEKGERSKQTVYCGVGIFLNFLILDEAGVVGGFTGREGNKIMHHLDEPHLALDDYVNSI